MLAAAMNHGGGCICHGKERALNSCNVTESKFSSGLSEFSSRLDLITNRDAVLNSGDLLLEIISSGAVEKCILAELQSILDEKGMAAGVRGGFHEIYSSQYAIVEIVTLQPSAGNTQIFMASMPFDAIFSPLSDGELVFTKYRMPPDTDLTQFDPDITLEKIEAHTVSRGDIVSACAGLDVVATDLSRPMYVLSIRTTTAADFLWTFNKQTARALFSEYGSASFSRYETALRLISEFHGHSNRPDMLESVVEEMTKHRVHSLRWLATQVQFKVNKPAVRNTLDRLASDPHPHVQRAASAALQKIALQ